MTGQQHLAVRQRLWDIICKNRGSENGLLDALQPEVDAMIAPMACGHPKACWVQQHSLTFPVGAPPNYETDGYCTACAHEAAALALFAQQVADWFNRYPGNTPIARDLVQEAILALVPNPSALTEHDAALLANAIAQSCKDPQFVRERMDRAAKLEAENAGLLSRVEDLETAAKMQAQVFREKTASLREQVASARLEELRYILAKATPGTWRKNTRQIIKERIALLEAASPEGR